METIDFQTLTRSVQERFVASVRGRVEPAPLAVAPLRLREPWGWSAVIVVSLVSLVALAAHSFGDLGRDDALQGTGAILAEGSLACDVAADCPATPIGALTLRPPAESPPGPCTIALRLTDPTGEIRATNAYTLTLRAPWQTTTSSLRTDS